MNANQIVPKIIVTSSQSLMKGMCVIGSKDPLFHTEITSLWESWLNQEDRPLKPNNALQYPMAKIFNETSISLDMYIGIEELCGEECTAKITYTRAEGILFYPPHITDTDLIHLFNKHLKSELVLSQ